MVSGPVVCVGVRWVTSTYVMTSSRKEVNATCTGDRRVERSRGTEHLLFLAVFKNKVSTVVGWVWQVMAQSYKRSGKTINLKLHLVWDVDTVVEQSVGINNHYNSNVLSNIIILNFYLYFNYFLYLSKAIIFAFVSYL